MGALPQSIADGWRRLKNGSLDQAATIMLGSMYAGAVACLLIIGIGGGLLGTGLPGTDNLLFEHFLLVGGTGLFVPVAGGTLMAAIISLKTRPRFSLLCGAGAFFCLGTGMWFTAHAMSSLEPVVESWLVALPLIGAIVLVGMLHPRFARQLPGWLLPMFSWAYHIAPDRELVALLQRQIELEGEPHIHKLLQSDKTDLLEAVLKEMPDEQLQELNSELFQELLQHQRPKIRQLALRSLGRGEEKKI